MTWSICYEFLRASTHPHLFSPPWRIDRALGFIEALLASPGFGVLLPTRRHAAVLAQTVSELPEIRGRVVHDLHIAALMREHGINRIWTRDRDFRRFPFLTVLDPTR